MARNLLDLYGNYIEGPRRDRSTPYDQGLWGTAGVPLFEQLHGDESGVEFTGNAPLTFNQGGTQMFRIGQRGVEIPNEWRKAGYDKAIQFDPTYGYYMPQDTFFKAQELFPTDMGWLGPLAMMTAMFGLPMLAAGGAGASAGASAGAGGGAAGGAGGGIALAPPGAGIGGVGTAGLGLSGTPTALLTPEMIAAGGGAGAFGGLPLAGAGTGAGLGLALTPGNAIVDTAAQLASQAGVPPLPPPTPPTTPSAGGPSPTPPTPPTTTPPTPPTPPQDKGPLDDLTTGSKIVDSIIGGAAAAGVGAAIGNSAEDEAAKAAEKAAEEQRRLEEERQRRIAEGTAAINAQFGGFNDDYYSGVAKAYRDHYNQLIAEQADEAKRKIRLGWPGGSGTSGYVRRMGDLTKDVERQYADISSQSVDFANKQRSDLESNRSAILAALEGGASLESLANQASATAERLSAPPAYSPIGDLFARLTSIPANRALAASVGYEPKPLQFTPKNPVTIIA